MKIIAHNYVCCNALYAVLLCFFCLLICMWKAVLARKFARIGWNVGNGEQIGLTTRIFCVENTKQLGMNECSLNIGLDESFLTYI